VMGNRDEDTLTSLANRITRLDKKINAEEKAKFKRLAKDKALSDVVHDLLNAYDPDKHLEKARQLFNVPKDKQPADDEVSKAKEAMIKEACAVFDQADFRNYVEDVQKSYEQIIDTVNLDKVVSAGFDKDAKEKARNVIDTFKKFIAENKNEILALRIFYSQPYKRRELTFTMIKELNEALQKPPYLLTTERIWNAYMQLEQDKVKGAPAKKMLTDIIALMRYEMGADKELRPYQETINQNFKAWVFKKNAGNRQFTDEQMEWLRMIKDHIATSVHLDKDDLDNTPFAERGGLGKVWQLFGDEVDGLIEELNETLAA